MVVALHQLPPPPIHRSHRRVFPKNHMIATGSVGDFGFVSYFLQSHTAILVSGRYVCPLLHFSILMTLSTPIGTYSLALRANRPTSRGYPNTPRAYLTNDDPDERQRYIDMARYFISKNINSFPSESHTQHDDFFNVFAAGIG